jgi:hypothetical protein
MIAVGIVLIVVLSIMYLFMSVSLLQQLAASITEAAKELKELLEMRLTELHVLFQQVVEQTNGEKELQSTIESLLTELKGAELDISHLSSINESATKVHRIISEIANGVPELKMSTSFIQQYHHVEDITSELHKAEHYYNTLAYGYNDKIGAIPLSIVAKYRAYQQVTYFTGDELIKE